MSTYNTNKVCFKCRVVSKGISTCPTCRQPMIDCGSRWRFPPRKDKKEWKELLELIKARNPYWKAKLQDVTL